MKKNKITLSGGATKEGVARTDALPVEEEQARNARLLLHEEEVNAERMVNRVALSIAVLLFLVNAVNTMITGWQWNAFSNILGICAYLLYNLVVYILLRTIGYRPALKYLSPAFTVSIVTLIVFGYANTSGWAHSLRTVTLLFYFVPIALSGLYCRPIVPLYTGALAAGEYSLLFLYVAFVERIPVGTRETFRVENISWDILFVYCSAFLIIGAGVAYASRRSRSLVDRLVKSEAQATFVRKVFGYYVSDSVRDNILRNKPELGGEERKVSILFSDIRGFTTLSEKLSASEIIDLLNDYFETMSGAIIENEGIINKFIGDGIVALYGTPLPVENHVYKAVMTALRMRELLAGFNKTLTKTGKPLIKIGIGIHTGNVVIGNVGSHQRMEYTAIGDTVNVASRVQEATKLFSTDILMTKDVYDALENHINVVRLPLVRVKGKEKPLTLYKIIGNAD